MKVLLRHLKLLKIESMKVEGKVLTDNSKIPNRMSIYFCSVGEKLKANVPHQQNSLIACKHNVNPTKKIPHSVETTKGLVCDVCCHIKTSFGSGLDDISNFSIILVLLVLAGPLAYLLHCYYKVEFFQTAGKLLG